VEEAVVRIRLVGQETEAAREARALVHQNPPTPALRNPIMAEGPALVRLRQVETRRARHQDLRLVAPTAAAPTVSKCMEIKARSITCTSFRVARHTATQGRICPILAATLGVKAHHPFHTARTTAEAVAATSHPPTQVTQTKHCERL